MDEKTVIIDSVSKSYGKLEALNGVTFSLKAGEITGLIGPNGAGKTTLIRLISTLLLPNSGSIYVCGLSTSDEAVRVRKRIGLMPENGGLYNKLSVFQNLKFYSSFYEVQNVDSVILDYLKMFELSDKMDVPVGELSKGMKDKVSFIRAVIHKPDVILLDEPLNGMDPESRIILKKTLQSLKERGKTILISSHDLLAVETVCDRVVMIEKGRLLIDENLDILKQKFNNINIGSLEEIYMALRRGERKS